MKFLLNKEALQTNIWGSAIAYFERVLGNVEIIPLNTIVPKRRRICRLQHAVESKFAGTITDKVSVFDKKIDVSTENLVLNISCAEIDSVFKNHLGKEIWAIEYHGKNISYFDNCGIGIYEVANNADTIRIDLVKYLSPDNKRIVDSAYYNPHYSACRNFQKILSTMPRIVTKNILNGGYAQIAFEGECQIENPALCNYLKTFYSSIIKKYWTIMANKMCGYYNEQWTVAIGEGSFIHNGLKNLNVQTMPKGEFWADPFIVDKDGARYLFFERFPFDQKKGIISVGDVENGCVHNVRDIIEQPYHLSYPNVFKEDGDYYMIPECSANNRVEIYKCIEFPDKWELFSTGFEGESLVDICYYKDAKGQQWLMASCSWNDVETHNEVFNIYQIDSLRLKKITPHKLNPIFIDSRKGRNGGRIFMENGKPIRTAQDNRFGKYGHGISLQMIDVLNNCEYSEHTVASILGSMVGGFDGTHQLCQSPQSFVMDLRK